MSEPISLPSGSVLSADAETWTDTLRDGTTIEVLAHARSVEGDYLVFSLLFEGQPRADIPILRIPISLLPDDYDLLS